MGSQHQIHLQELSHSRLKLGRSLFLGLGFLVGADIIKTAVAPTGNEFGIDGWADRDQAIEIIHKAEV